jgi:pyruvate dehydrogenase E2 component (dihydrolipoamide acetyltransferase)
MKELKFVDVGEGITEGNVKKWLFKDGDSVKEDTTIVQIETDKAVVNIPAPVSGKLKIVAKENTTLKTGDTIAFVGDDVSTTTPQQTTQGPSSSVISKAIHEQESIKEFGFAPDSDAAINAPSTSTAQPQKTTTQPQTNINQQQTNTIQPQMNTTKQQQKTEVIATPGVRKLARDLNIDINTVKGTGPNGKILENDVRSASISTNKKTSIPKFSETLEKSHTEDIERVPLTQTRKAIAKNMELSWSIPRAVHMDHIDVTNLYDLVKREKENMAKRNVKLTFLPFIIKATIEAIKENPRFNSSYDHEKLEIILKKYYNIGLAAQGPDGLKVVVIKNSEKKNISDIAKEIQMLSEKVKKAEVSLEDMSDSTFTITNIGSLGGGDFSVPMINYPEVAILGIHLIRDTPVVKDGEIQIRKILPFSLTFDHRVVDGADAVAFGNALKRYLEDPDFLELIA